jgi:hypothetical protein
MTPDQARDAIGHIRANAGDFEVAHAMQDDLYADVLNAIAHGAPNPAQLAAIALEAASIDFPRHYA